MSKSISTKIANAKSLYVYIVLIAGFAGLAAWWGIHLEYSSDTTFPLAYRGVINSVAIRTLYIYELYWGELLSFAYKKWPQIPFHGCLLFIYSLTGQILFLGVGYHTLRRISLPKIFELLLLLPFIAIASVNFFWIDFTRAPMLIIAALVVLVMSSNLFSKSAWFIFLAAILFVSAYWIRPESGLLAIALTTPLVISFLISDFKKYLKQALFLLTFSAMAISTEYLHGQLYQDQTAVAIKKMYDLHFSFFDAYHQNGLAAEKSPADSIRFEAMLNDFQSDKDSLSLKQYAVYVTGRAFSLDVLNNAEGRWHRMRLFALKLLNFHKGLLLLYLCLLLLCGIVLNNWKHVLWLLFNQLYCWLAIFSIVFFTKAAERTYEPMIAVASLLIIAHTLLYFKCYNSFFLKMGSICITVLCVFGFGHWLKEYQHKSQHYKDLEAANIKNVELIDKIHQKTEKIVFTIDAWELFNMGVFKEYSNVNKPFFMHDAHINYYDKRMDTQLREFGGGSSITDFYNKIAEESYILLASPKRIKLITDYLRIVHNQSFHYIDITADFHDNNNVWVRNIRFYELRKFE